MHVGLNLVFLVPGATGGMEVYARELVRALPAADPGLRLTAFVNREVLAAGGPWEEHCDVVAVPVRARNRVEWVRGEQLLRRASAPSRRRPVHSLAGTARRPDASSRRHDPRPALQAVPEADFGLRGLGMRALVPLAARRSHRIIADSQATARDLRELLGVRAARIDVVPLGCGTTARVSPEAEGVLRDRHGLGNRPVVLSVSAKRPHKNLVRLIEAVADVHVDQRPMLVIPGYPTPHEDELRERARALGVTDDLRLLGWISPAELEGLYALASVFAFPSLHEGFGLPVLEAMTRGVPVVSSNRSSLPEVARDAALLVDPENSTAIGAAIMCLLGDAAERGRLADLGRAQARRFTWEQTAALTAASYRAAMPGAGNLTL